MRNVEVLLRQAAHVGSRARYMAAHVTPRAMASQRGAFIVFEGGDRCGKTTQSHNLVEYLTSSGVKAELWKFPDRQTSTGALIDSYLNSKEELDDAAVHLLYSANRWEKREQMLTSLQQGITLVVDRYSYSGIVFTSAKKIPGLDLEWCKGPEAGLPAPDLVLYLRMPNPEDAAKRGGFGSERYEKTAFQREVQRGFDDCRDSSWMVLDASKSVKELQQEVQAATEGIIQKCKAGLALRKLWTAQSPPLSSIDNTYS